MIDIAIRPCPYPNFSIEESQRVKIDSSRGIVSIKTDNGTKSFQFGTVYPMNATQSYVYNKSVKSIVGSVLDGYNGAIICYGQSGTGKTYTTEGKIDSKGEEGMIILASKQIFEYISEHREKHFIVHATFYQIFMEDAYDLLSSEPKKKSNFYCTHDGIFIKGLTDKVVNSTKEIKALIKKGATNRIVRESSMNNNSSRSHVIFTICIEQDMGLQGVKSSKLQFVDLAGTESIAYQPNKEIAAQGNKINLSILALNTLMNQIAIKERHVSYRASKITQVLQEPLGGNSKTLIIATMTPNDFYVQWNLVTLDFANKAKCVINTPRINVKPQYAEDASKFEKK